MRTLKSLLGVICLILVTTKNSAIADYRLNLRIIESNQICESQSMSRLMPGVVLDYIRLSAALEMNSLGDFKKIAKDLGFKFQLTQKLPERAIASNLVTESQNLKTGGENANCTELVRPLSRLGELMHQADSVKEAREKLTTLSHLIAEWGYLYSNR